MIWDRIAPRVLYWVCWVLYRLRCPSTWAGAYLVLGTLAIGYLPLLREWTAVLSHELDLLLIGKPKAQELSIDQMDHRIALMVLLLSCYFWCVADGLFRKLHPLRRGKYHWVPPGWGGRPHA